MFSFLRFSTDYEGYYGTILGRLLYCERDFGRDFEICIDFLEGVG